MKWSLILFGFLFLPNTAQSQTTWYVPDHFPAGIQAALSDAAVLDGDTIIVRPGTYAENIDFLGKAVHLISESGPHVTTIDGNQNGSVVTFKNGEGSGAVLEGFTITNGTGTWFQGPGWEGYCGGGIFCRNGSWPVIRNNVITKNKVDDVTQSSAGGGIDCEEVSMPLIEYNLIIDNEANWGGGIQAYNSSPTIMNNLISGNTVDVSGGALELFQTYSEVSYNEITYNSAYNAGGIQIEFGEPLLRNNTVSHNTASNQCGGVRCWGTFAHLDSNFINDNSAASGGGIHCTKGASPEITNNMISYNTANNWGGGISIWFSSSALIVNNTFYKNKGAMGGGGIELYDYSDAEVVNTIFWMNSAPEGPEIRLELYSTLSIRYSDLCGGMGSAHVEPDCTLNWGAGNIDTDPLFVEPLNGDFHLTLFSPCIDAGDNAEPSLPATDFEGDPRIVPGNGKGIHAVGGPPMVGVVDMGADEYCVMKRETFFTK